MGFGDSYSRWYSWSLHLGLNSVLGSLWCHISEAPSHRPWQQCEVALLGRRWKGAACGVKQWAFQSGVAVGGCLRAVDEVPH